MMAMTLASTLLAGTSPRNTDLPPALIFSDIFAIREVDPSPESWLIDEMRRTKLPISGDDYANAEECCSGN